MAEGFSMGSWHSDQDVNIYDTIKTIDCANSTNFLQVTDQHDGCYPWYTWYPTTQKNAFEEVQDAILAKIKVAIDGDDLKEAKRLLELAGKLKELKND